MMDRALLIYISDLRESLKDRGRPDIEHRRYLIKKLLYENCDALIQAAIEKMKGDADAN